MEKYKAFFYSPPDQDTSALYLTVIMADGRRACFVYGTPELYIPGEGEYLKPAISFYGTDAPVKWQVIAEALAKEGYTAGSDAKMIDALKYHLEDLRKLLKLRE